MDSIDVKMRQKLQVPVGGTTAICLGHFNAIIVYFDYNIRRSRVTVLLSLSDKGYLQATLVTDGLADMKRAVL